MSVTMYDVLQKLVDLNAKEFGNDHQAAVDAIDAAFGVEKVVVPETPAQSGGSVVGSDQAAAAQTAQGYVEPGPDPVAAAQQAPQPVVEVPSFLQPPADASPVAGLPTDPPAAPV